MEYADRANVLLPLGKGEAAALAIAANRGWRAGIDDAAARRVAEENGIRVVTTREWLIEQVSQRALGEREATALYSELLHNQFWGPPTRYG